MKRVRLLAAGIALVAMIGPVLAAGLWWGLPLMGGPSYCVSFNQAGVPGTTPTCTSTAPAGPTTFTGFEAVPTDLYGPGAPVTNQAPSSAYTSVLQLGQGAFTILASTTSATTVTVGPQTEWLFENATVTNPTITFTASPLQGQKLTIIQGANLTTGITTAAGAGSTCLPACGALTPATAGITHSWVYEGTIWYQVQ